MPHTATSKKRTRAEKEYLADRKTCSVSRVGWVSFAVVVVQMGVFIIFAEIQGLHMQGHLILDPTPSIGVPGSAASSSNAVRALTVDPGRYPPFSCSRLLQNLKTDGGMQDLDPNRGTIHSRRTITEPPFYISLHNETFDRTRWDIMVTGEYYERKLSAAFRDVLKSSPPGARILDVGANIGFFSLLSGAQGPFVVDSFEPNIKNQMRFCESLNLNRWFRTEFNTPWQQLLMEEDPDLRSPIFNLYSYGVGREEGNFVFLEASNPGQGKLNLKRGTATDSRSVPIVTLDAFARERGWFESWPHIAILKIDVEGSEFTVIEGAKELLKTHMIRNIFMEVSLRTQSERDDNIPFLHFLSGVAGYRLHQIGNWEGPSQTVLWPNDGQLVEKISQAAEKKPGKQLNLWWTIMDDATAI